ncbi:antirestriction protein ArdA [Glycomyces sp. MUSA5-2]|uniref:antirestriction protein ArdA n=1 Tax=Glycomyces sp. MUSA5-2 TaxID=2053002 RepID=UPI003009859D
MQAWVGCWACYNEGFLVGAWFDLPDQTPSIELVHQLGVDHGDHRDDLELHEEIGVFDLDGDLGHFSDAIGESVVTAVEVARVLDDMEPDQRAVFAAYVKAVGEPASAELAAQCEGNYIGAFASVRAFGMEHGADLLGWHELPGHVQEVLDPYIDWEEVGENDLLDYESARIGRTLHVWHLE